MKCCRAPLCRDRYGPLTSLAVAAVIAISLSDSARGDLLRGVQFATQPGGLGAEYGTRTALCCRTAQPPELDGILDDPCWVAAEKITGFRVSAQPGALALHQTVLQMSYDDNFLYVAFRCEHPNARAMQCQFSSKDRDGLVFRDESVEMFFDTEHTHQRYHQIIVTAAGAIFDDRGEEVVSESVDSSGSSPRLTEKTDFKIDASWNSTAEFVPSREEDAWVIEGRIPLEDFGVSAVVPGTVWGFQACRNEVAAHAQNVWAPIVGPTFHAPRSFGNLIFDQPVLTLSDLAWGVSRGKCQLRVLVRPDGNEPRQVALRLSLLGHGNEQELGSVERRLPQGQPTLLDIAYALPKGLDAGKLVLSAEAEGKPVCVRSHYFVLPPSVEVRIPRNILSTASESLDVVVRIHYGVRSLANAKLTIQVRNLATGRRCRGGTAKIGGTLAAISLDPKALGEGNGEVQATLVGADGETLGTASATYEIIGDPFAE